MDEIQKARYDDPRVINAAGGIQVRRTDGDIPDHYAYLAPGTDDHDAALRGDFGAVQPYDPADDQTAESARELEAAIKQKIRENAILDLQAEGVLDTDGKLVESEEK